MIMPERNRGETSGPLLPSVGSRLREPIAPIEGEPVTRLAGCIIRNRLGQILLLHKNTPKRVQWEIPGGKVDVDKVETEHDAAKRELLEELGVVVDIKKTLGQKDFEQGGKRRRYTWVEAAITHGTPTIKDTDEVDKLGWFSPAQLEEMRDEISGNTVNFIDAVQSGEVQFADQH